MEDSIHPKIIQFQKTGHASEGYISIAEAGSLLSFEIKRVFWTYETPMDVSRGRHAHHELKMVLVALKGEIRVKTISCDGEENSFTLHDPSIGLMIPNLCWHEMWYTPGAIQLVLASTDYDEGDYIRDFQIFKTVIARYDETI